MGNNTLISLTCPQCHAQLEINSTELQITCKHCGASILVKDFITARRVDNQDKQVSYQALADNAFKNKDWAKAFEYYEKLCKISPTSDNLRNMNIASLFSGRVQIQQSTLNFLYELPLDQHREMLSEMLKHINSLKTKELTVANTISDDNKKNNAISSINIKYAPAIQALVAETNKLKPINCSCGGQLQYNEDVCGKCGKAKQVILKEQNDKKNKQTLILVAVCVIGFLIIAAIGANSPKDSQNITPSVTTTATEATTTAIESSTENPIDEETMQKLIVSILEENMQKGFGDNCTVEYNEELDSYVVSAWNDGLAEYAMYSEDLTEWNNLIDSMKNTSKVLLTSIQELDPDANITLNVLNDQNTDNVLLMIYNNEVVYNVRSA